MSKVKGRSGTPAASSTECAKRSTFCRTIDERLKFARGLLLKQQLTQDEFARVAHELQGISSAKLKSDHEPHHLVAHGALDVISDLIGKTARQVSQGFLPDQAAADALSCALLLIVRDCNLKGKALEPRNVMPVEATDALVGTPLIEALIETTAVACTAATQNTVLVMELCYGFYALCRNPAHARDLTRRGVPAAVSAIMRAPLEGLNLEMRQMHLGALKRSTEPLLKLAPQDLSRAELEALGHLALALLPLTEKDVTARLRFEFRASAINSLHHLFVAGEAHRLPIPASLITLEVFGAITRCVKAVFSRDSDISDKCTAVLQRWIIESRGSEPKERALPGPYASDFTEFILSALLNAPPLLMNDHLQLDISRQKELNDLLGAVVIVFHHGTDNECELLDQRVIYRFCETLASQPGNRQVVMFIVLNLVCFAIGTENRQMLVDAHADTAIIKVFSHHVRSGFASAGAEYMGILDIKMGVHSLIALAGHPEAAKRLCQPATLMTVIVLAGMMRRHVDETVEVRAQGAYLVLLLFDDVAALDATPAVKKGVVNLLHACLELSLQSVTPLKHTADEMLAVALWLLCAKFPEWPSWKTDSKTWSISTVVGYAKRLRSPSVSPATLEALAEIIAILVDR